MNIYERLKRDHQIQKDLATRIMDTTGDSEDRRQLFQQFKIEAEAHAAAEEQTFYATLIEKHKAQEKARHSISEHKEAADIIDELGDTDFGSGGWIQKFKKLKNELEHHMDEEENEVFELARKLINSEEADQLADKFNQRKSDSNLQ